MTARLSLVYHTPSISQRQLAAEMGVSQAKANYCPCALVEKGLVKLGNFSMNPNTGKYAYILTPARLEEKNRITLCFLGHKETEFEAIRQEIESLKGDLESQPIAAQGINQSFRLVKKPRTNTR